MRDNEFESQLDSTFEFLQEGDVFELIESPNFEEASSSLFAGDSTPWEVSFLGHDGSMDVKYVQVQSLRRIDEPDTINRFFVSGTLFPNGDPVNLRFELGHPTDDPYLFKSYVTFFDVLQDS